MSKRTPSIFSKSPLASSAKEGASLTLDNIQELRTKNCTLISKDTRLDYLWAVSSEGKRSFRLAFSKAGGQCNSRRFDVDPILARLKMYDRPFKTSDVAKIINVGCKNSAGFVIAALVNEGLVEQLPSQVVGKKSRPRLFRVVRPSKFSA